MRKALTAIGVVAAAALLLGGGYAREVVVQAPGLWQAWVDGGQLVTTPSPVMRTAFGSMKVEQETPEVHLLFSNNINSALVRIAADAGTGALSWSGGMATVSTGTGDAGLMHVDSVQSVKYIPGQGMIAKFTAVFSPCRANSEQEIGVDNDGTQDGLMFACVDGGFGIVHRIAGVDTFIPQSSWTPGIQGMAFDPTVGNVYRIQMQYLGFGPMTYWIENPSTGDFVLAHRDPWGGSPDAGGGGHTTPSLTNPTLGLHLAVANQGNASNISLSTASMGLAREGKESVYGVPRGFSATKTLSGSPLSFFALRVKSTFGPADSGSEVRVRLSDIGFTAVNQAIIVSLVLNPGLGGSPSFTDVDTATSVLQYDSAGTTLDGGRILGQYIAGNGSPQSGVDIWTRKLLLNPGDTLVVSGMAPAGTPVSSAALNVLEEF